MSKSILVIDTPKGCGECPCCIANEYGLAYCRKENKYFFTYDIEKFKPDWCQLKYAPRKLAVDSVDEDNRWWTIGYNACIDKILKGANVNE